MYTFFFNAAFFNFFYNKILVILIKMFYVINIKYIEKGFLELYGPVGLYIKFRKFKVMIVEFDLQIIFILLYFLYLFY